MTVAYLDTSAAGKLLIAEAESPALAAWADQEGIELLGTLLVETELRRIAAREDVPQAAVSELLERVSLFELPASLFREAGLLPGPQLRTLDALHLASAIRLNVDLLVTYDARLGEAATGIGLPVLSPS